VYLAVLTNKILEENSGIIIQNTLAQKDTKKTPLDIISLGFFWSFWAIVNICRFNLVIRVYLAVLTNKILEENSGIIIQNTLAQKDTKKDP
jgi:hypothetical protein